MEIRKLGTNPMIENKIESNELVDKKKRQRQVIECLEELEKATASEIANLMFYKGYTRSKERNNSAPRLTELLQIGIVEPIGKKKDIWTGRSVTVFQLIEKKQ